MSGNKNVIIGYSGHAYVVAESYLSCGKSLHFYTESKKAFKNPFDLEYLGFETDSNFIGWGMNLTYILGIGDNNLRERVATLLIEKLQSIESVLDPSTIISKNVIIGDGVYAAKGVIINPFSKIGNFSILNTGCIIEHECEIGIATHIAPGAVLAGNVKIGNKSFIGANSVIKQGLTIGDNVIIGAGSVVLNNIESNTKVAGNPAKEI